MFCVTVKSAVAVSTHEPTHVNDWAMSRVTCAERRKQRERARARTRKGDRERENAKKTER